MHAQATPRGSRLKSPAIYEDVESQQYRLLGQQPNSRARGQHGLCERVTAPSQTWVPAPHPFLALGRRKRQCKTGQTSHGTRRNLHRLHTHTHTHTAGAIHSGRMVLYAMTNTRVAAQAAGAERGGHSQGVGTTCLRRPRGARRCLYAYMCRSAAIGAAGT